MSRKGKKFELEYKWLYELEKEKFSVKSPGYVRDKITGRKREIDVLLRYKDIDGLERKIGIECRDRKHVEDVTWIEQLKTKKEDCELDCIIATTTKTLNKNAIKKARAHGIFVERAETFSKETIANIKNEFFFDIYFMKSELLKLDFMVNKSKVTYKQLINQLSFYHIEELKKFINIELYMKFDPGEVIRINDFKIEDFYTDTNNELVIEGNDLIEKGNGNILNKLNIEVISYKIKYTPYKLTMPLSKSISTFDLEKKRSKKYRGTFEGNEDFFEIGYIDETNLVTILNLKKRQFRCVGMHMSLNTTFPNIENKIKIDEKELFDKAIGEFDFTNIL